MTTSAVRQAAAKEWARRIEAEYTSASIAQTIGLWLIQAGGPPDLIRDTLRVVDDELAHSELAAGVVAATGVDAPVAVDRGRLTLPSGGDPVGDLLDAVVRHLCVGETVAVPLFAMLHRGTTQPVARAALDRIVRDEARHRTLGWDLLDWLLDGHPELAGTAADLAWTSAHELRTAHAAGVGPGDELADGAAAWGLASPADYVVVVDRALERDLRPRLEART